MNLEQNKGCAVAVYFLRSCANGGQKQYDLFWESLLDLLRDLISRAAKYGYAETRDPRLRKVRQLSDRSFSGRVRVCRTGILPIGSTIMAHMKSLGNTLLRLGLLKPYGGEFVIRMNAAADTLRAEYKGGSSTDAASAGGVQPPVTTPPASGGFTHNDVISLLDALGSDILWARATKDTVLLFRTLPDASDKAVFDEKGFFLSAEAERVYGSICSEPHIYIARLRGGKYPYIGRSLQACGRWKREHAYHLGGLAYELLGTTRYDDQRSHRYWVEKWFRRETMRRTSSGLYAIETVEPVVISFWALPGASRELLGLIEKHLINYADETGLRPLNVLR